MVVVVANNTATSKQARRREPVSVLPVANNPGIVATPSAQTAPQFVQMYSCCPKKIIQKIISSNKISNDISSSAAHKGRSSLSTEICLCVCEGAEEMQRKCLARRMVRGQRKCLACCTCSRSRCGRPCRGCGRARSRTRSPWAYLIATPIKPDPLFFKSAILLFCYFAILNEEEFTVLLTHFVEVGRCEGDGSR